MNETDKLAAAVGTRIGNAIARDVLADDLPQGWSGLTPEDGDQLTAAGIEVDTPAWEAGEAAAKAAYLAAITE